MGVYTAAVQQLYVAYFNRPADVAGQAYWEGVVAKANGSTAAVSAAFAASAEYKAAYAGLDAYHVVAQVYQNLFGHAPDLPGLNFWGQALIAGQMTVDNVVTEIAKGAQGTDLTAYNNKVAAATAFTVALDTPAEVLAYSGDAANAAAKTFISSVTDDASLAAAIAPAALNNTVSGIVDAGNVGKMFTLTQGQDIIVGTAGNDTINVTTFNPTTGATATNLSSIDSIDGGAGKDTLNLDLTGGTNSVSGVTIKNVEIINLTGAATTDASVFQGATNINFDATGTSVTKLAAGTTVAFNGTASDITVGAAGASASVALNNVIETAALNVGGSALSSVTVSGTRVDGADSGTSVSAQNLNVTVGKDVQALTLNTNQASVLTVAQTTGSTKAFTTINASGSTGALTIDGTGMTSLANITTGTGNDSVTLNATTSAATSSAAAVNATVTTGDGNDTVVVNSTGAGMTTVDAGAGNDKVTVSATTGPVTVLGGAGNDTVTINKVLATTDVINGGDGTDTISFAGAAAHTADDYIVFNKLVTNFETISFSTAETGLDASQLAATYTGIDLATGSIVTGVGTQAITAHGDVDLTAAGYKTGSSTTYAGTLGVSESADGSVVVKADVLNLTVKAAAANDVTATLSGDVRTANVTLTNTVDSASNTTADRVAHFVLTTNADALAGPIVDKALASLTLTGSGDATVTNADGTKLVTVDASGLNGTSAVAANNGAALHGLTYTSSNTAAETIKLGAAVDTITLNASTYGAMDTVTGLKLVANSDATDVTSASDVLHVTAIDGPAVKFTTTQTDIQLALKDAAASSKGDNLVFQLGGDTYVFHDAGTPNQIDGADTVVKITGAVDLDTLILSLAHTV
jgi:trimeric autotransporter adhesin